MFRLTLVLAGISLELNTKVNRLYRQFLLAINLVFVLRKSVNYSVNLFSNRNMHSAGVQPLPKVVYHSCFSDKRAIYASSRERPQIISCTSECGINYNVQSQW